MKIACVVGTRPNFVKISSFLRELSNHKNIQSILIHTGQHYDKSMSESFFSDLEINNPDVYFGVGSKTNLNQFGTIIISAEHYFLTNKPDLIVVVGDVNSTLAVALVGAKLNIPVAHIEAGLRSRNWNMPEELNRVLTDRISELLLTPTGEDSLNLLNEGISKDKIHFVGNIMIDTLMFNLSKISDKNGLLTKYGISEREYVLLTLHRSECVDNRENLEEVLSAIAEISEKIRIIFPLHPRTKKNIQKYDLMNILSGASNLSAIKPLGYLDFLTLMKNAKFIMTDSGGIQEESTVLGLPCLTLREETERPITVKIGTNQVVGIKKTTIIPKALDLLEGRRISGEIPKFWDGKTANRIVEVISHRGNLNL